MKKFLDLLFNVIWVIFVGISAVFANVSIGLTLICTIIGIPFGLQYFKFIPLVFAPAGKVVKLNFDKHIIMNLLWLIFGGLEIYLVYELLALLLMITIIGIPLGIQLHKIAIFNLAPFGAEIYSK